MTMSRLIPTAIALVLALLPSLASAQNSSAIVHEAARPIKSGDGRVASFWWLPQEYWEQVARELAIPAEEQEKVRVAFRDYLLVAALESKLDAAQKPTYASIAEIVDRAEFYRNGKKLEVLREVNPEVARLTASLVYLLRASLSGLGEGLRVLPLANVDAKGNPILAGAAPGELRLEYRFDDSGPAHAVMWRAPFTAIAGTNKCPKGGEELEASWAWCPWHGVKLGDD